MTTTVQPAVKPAAVRDAIEDGIAKALNALGRGRRLPPLTWCLRAHASVTPGYSVAQLAGHIPHRPGDEKVLQAWADVLGLDRQDGNGSHYVWRGEVMGITVEVWGDVACEASKRKPVQ